MTRICIKALIELIVFNITMLKLSKLVAKSITSDNKNNMYKRLNRVDGFKIRMLSKLVLYAKAIITDKNMYKCLNNVYGFNVRMLSKLLLFVKAMSDNYV